MSESRAATRQRACSIFYSVRLCFGPNRVQRMWIVVLIAFLSVTQLSSHEIRTECRERSVFPKIRTPSPALLAELKVEQVTVRGTDMMNISWAINIDSSISYLEGTRILISGQSHHCNYIPAFKLANLTDSEQKWFHYLVKKKYGHSTIQAANLPLPPGGANISTYKSCTVDAPKPRTPMDTTVPMSSLIICSLASTVTDVITSPAVEKEGATDKVNFISIMVAIFGGLGGLVILYSCYIIYRSYGANVAISLGFTRLPQSPMAVVPVLLVYPAENSAFQQAVVTLAEFLQLQGGCSVAVDMWQQRKIAELGPMRWLAEKTKAAHRVLIVCPQLSSQPSCSPPNHTSLEPSIPAAAYDLYPLILNMVAGHSKNAGDMAKFWVVQLGEQHDKKPCNLAVELSACKKFCLMKDLNKLCRNLHTQSLEDKTMSDPTGPGSAFSEKSTVALRNAVEKLVFVEAEPVKSLVTIV